ncbi:FMN-binding protein MioC [Bowmanella dokdonensis]|uniref:FMN-binding protein MioC n=1 Tax=Bowmanella dokdonensis TaxID=751969 RepID=A0A939DNJ6_9ALTE|nr:FMN-binding protein MioC [Bowmanella dokdonensis]
MTQFEIVVGSMLGATEYVADAVGEKLEQLGISFRIHLAPDLHELDQAAVWLICSSTHGAGDLPDNIQTFAGQLHKTSLRGIRYLLIGLGDSSYDTFCEGGKQLHRLMQQAGAEAIAEPCYIDVLSHPIPEDEAVSWLADCLSQCEWQLQYSATGTTH